MIWGREEKILRLKNTLKELKKTFKFKTLKLLNFKNFLNYF